MVNANVDVGGLRGRSKEAKPCKTIKALLYVYWTTIVPTFHTFTRPWFVLAATRAIMYNMWVDEHDQSRAVKRYVRKLALLDVFDWTCILYSRKKPRTLWFGQSNNNGDVWQLFLVLTMSHWERQGEPYKRYRHSIHCRRWICMRNEGTSNLEIRIAFK